MSVEPIVPVLYMNIGVPCSGKSTFSNDICCLEFESIRILLNDSSPRLKLLSTDQIIEEIAESCDITYNEAWKDLIKFAEKIMYKNLKDGIVNNRSMVWDQTNVSKKVRRDKILKIPNTYRLVALYFPTDPALIRSRNEKRTGKVIPEKVIDDMLSRMEEPSFDEGFDDIFTINFVNGSYVVSRSFNLQKVECVREV